MLIVSLFNLICFVCIIAGFLYSTQWNKRLVIPIGHRYYGYSLEERPSAWMMWLEEQAPVKNIDLFIF